MVPPGVVDLIQVLSVIAAVVWGFARISIDSRHLAESIIELRETIAGLRVDVSKMADAHHELRDRVTKLEAVRDVLTVVPLHKREGEG